MAVKYLELGECYNHTEAVFRLLCDGVSEEVELLEEGEASKELKRFVEVLEFIL